MEGWEGWVVDRSTSWKSAIFRLFLHSRKFLETSFLLDDFIAQEPVFFSMATTQQQSPTKLWLNNQNFTKYSFQRQGPPHPHPHSAFQQTLPDETTSSQSSNDHAGSINQGVRMARCVWDLAAGAGWAPGVAWVWACRGHDPRRRVWFKQDRRRLGAVNLCEPCLKATLGLGQIARRTERYINVCFLHGGLSCKACVRFVALVLPLKAGEAGRPEISAAGKHRPECKARRTSSARLFLSTPKTCATAVLQKRPVREMKPFSHSVYS